MPKGQVTANNPVPEESDEIQAQRQRVEHHKLGGDPTALKAAEDRLAVMIEQSRLEGDAVAAAELNEQISTAAQAAHDALKANPPKPVGA